MVARTGADHERSTDAFTVMLNDGAGDFSPDDRVDLAVGTAETGEVQLFITD